MSLATIAELSDVITTKFELQYAAILEKAGQLGQLFTEEITTDTLAARIPFTTTWTGLDEQDVYASVNYETVTAQYVTIDAKKHAKGIRAGKYEWTDSVTQSLLMGQVNTLAAEAALVRTKTITNWLNGGETSAYPALYGGGNFFDTTHSLNGTTFSNLLINNPFSVDGFQAALDVLTNIPLGPDGEPLPMEGAEFYVLGGTTMKAAFNLVLNSTAIPTLPATLGSVATFADNPYRGMATPLTSSYLNPGGRDWYLIAKLPGAISAFGTVRNSKSSPSLIARISESDPNVIENNLYLWNLQLVEQTWGVHWYLVVKSTDSGSSSS